MQHWVEMKATGLACERAGRKGQKWEQRRAATRDAKLAASMDGWRALKTVALMGGSRAASLVCVKAWKWAVSKDDERAVKWVSQQAVYWADWRACPRAVSKVGWTAVERV